MAKELTEEQIKALLESYDSRFSVGVLLGKVIAFIILMGLLLTLGVWIKWGITSLFF